jgi:hypothetical protein
MSIKRISMAFSFALTLACSSALARECKLDGRGGENVFVWIDSKSQSEAYKLIAAKVHETNRALVTRLLACTASPGDTAVIVESSLASYKIVVTSGKQAGCRGVVGYEWCSSK